MLTDLTKNIEKGLMSYMKGQEGAGLHDQYKQGLLGIVIQCKQVSDERKRDIQALYAICEKAEEQKMTPQACITVVTDYLNKMATGFLFFRGQSKLKNSVIDAINIYDPRYILNSTTHPIQLDDHAMEREIQPRLAPNPFPVLPAQGEGGDDQHIPAIVQKNLDSLRAEIDELKLGANTNKVLLQRSNERVIQKDQEIADLKTELIALQGQLAGLTGTPKPGPANGTRSMPDDGQHAPRRASFSH